MKRIILSLAIVGLTSLSFTSCRENTEETNISEEAEANRDIEQAEREVETEQEGVLERTGEEIDNEVNQEIDEEIDKIGDDN